MGIDPRDVDQPIGTLSGGERQCVAIARAVYFGAKVLVLDEPTAALGVKQSGVVLKYVAAARDAGLGVVLITHNPHHAYLVGDRFVLLRRGATVGAPPPRDGITLEELTRQLAGGDDLDDLRHELRRSWSRRADRIGSDRIAGRRRDRSAPVSGVRRVATRAPAGPRVDGMVRTGGSRGSRGRADARPYPVRPATTRPGTAEAARPRRRPARHPAGG